MKYLLSLFLVLVFVACRVKVNATMLSPDNFPPIPADSVRIVLPSTGQTMPELGCVRLAMLDAKADTDLGLDASDMFKAVRKKAASMGANVLVLLDQNTNTGFFDSDIQSRALAMHCQDAHLPPRDNDH